MYYSPGNSFAIGVPKKIPPVPAGWTLRTSIFDYPAMIDPGSVEWLIDQNGKLHEVQSNKLTCARYLTGKTRNTNDETPPGTL